MRYKLVLVDTVHGTEPIEWALELPADVGRSPDVAICIAHHSVSRRHCRFHLNAEGALEVKDLGSLNGTYFDDKRVNRAVLMPGDCIQIGTVTLRVKIASDTVVPDDRPRAKGDMFSTQPMKTLPPDKLKRLSSDPRWNPAQ